MVGYHCEYGVPDAVLNEFLEAGFLVPMVL